MIAAHVLEDFTPWKQDPDRIESISMLGLGTKNDRTSEELAATWKTTHWKVPNQETPI